MVSVGPKRRYLASGIGSMPRVSSAESSGSARLAGGAGRARLVVIILLMVGNPLVVRESCEIVVFGGLEMGSRGCDGALQRHG